MVVELMAEFTIYDGISNKEFTDVTKDNGFIRVENNIVDPGIYKYEVREIKSASKKYTNIMENCKIVLWVKVNPNGEIKMENHLKQVEKNIIFMTYKIMIFLIQLREN